MASRRCPQCGVPVSWDGNPDRPFCSERCRLIDLEGWLGERYAIPGEPLAAQADDGDDAGVARGAVADARRAAAAPRPGRKPS
jgi:endogenous inhibitor of DNA gyrase (YacG/DUF329 family)